MPVIELSLWDPRTRSVAYDLELEIQPDTSIASVLAVLPAARRDVDYFVGDVRLDPRGDFADSPIVGGCYISVGAPGPVVRESTEWAVGVLRVGGDEVTRAARWLRPGRYDIARRSTAAISVLDPEISRQNHAIFTVAEDGTALIEDGGSVNGVFVNGDRIAEPTTVGPDDEIVLGTSVLRWRPSRGGVLPGVRQPDGLIHFDRSFARSPGVPSRRLKLPIQDSFQRNVWATILSVLLPVVGAGALAAILRQPTFLVFALLGPISGLGTFIVEGQQRKSRRRRFEADKLALEGVIAEHVLIETKVRQERYPDLDTLMPAAVGGSGQLWPRNAADSDSLVLRMGTASQAAGLQFDGDPWPEFEPPTISDAPVTVDLRQAGVLGLVGEGSGLDDLVRWLLVQLATIRSPGDLNMVVISASGGEQLAWTRWLPHVSGDGDGALPGWVGNTVATRLRRVKELRDLVLARKEQIGPSGRSQTSFDDVVVVLDGALSLRQLPGMKEILQEGPVVGVYTICIDGAAMNECRAECRRIADGSLLVTASRNSPGIVTRQEGCDESSAEHIARALAPMRDRLTLATSAQSMPYPVRFLGVVGIDGVPTAEQIRALWLREPGPTTRVPLGMDAEGVVTVDLAEQGPHTMLGGATGAGKSYLLQTLVTSLLMANTPNELNLVLVDFKGGSAFSPFENCPHVVSLIRSTGATAADVFDAAAAVRVLASVATEVRRREALLARYGGEIDEYWRERRHRPELEPLPRLVMIFDEFARVLDTAPDFLKQLVNVAGKGRSLGMHLVLATQSLQGKLSPELKNNIDLRITLRQNEPADSTEVLGVPDAATIPGRLRGRGLILCTKDEVRIPRSFQTGFLGAPPPKEGTTPARARTVPWTSFGMERPLDQAPEGGLTDQQLIIDAIEVASAGMQAPFLPLRPPLPASLTLADLPPFELSPTAIPFGLIDSPAEQSQPPAVLDLAGSDRIMVGGGPQTGRTTYVRTLITSVAQRLGPDRAHLYVVEREPGGLVEFAALPHCGGVISGQEPDRVRRLVEWLGEELGRRRLRRQVNPSPAAIVLVIDGWEALEDRSDPTRVETSVLTGLREIIAGGVTSGIHVVLTGGQDMLNSKIANSYQQRLIMNFPKLEVRRQHLLGGVPLPAAVPGRAGEAGDGQHVQICEPGVSAATVVAWARATYAGVEPSSLPVTISSLPESVSRSSLPSAKPDRIPLGLGGPRVEPVGVDLFGDDPNLLLISGPDDSGRTTVLQTVLDGLLDAGVPVLLLPGARSPLSTLTSRPGVLEVLAGQALDDADLRSAADRLRVERYAVLVDDFQQLVVNAMPDGFDVKPTLLQDITLDGGHTRALVMAGDALPVLHGQRRAMVRVMTEMVDSGHRFLLTPTKLIDAREHGLSLEADQLFAAPAGRGYLATGRSVTLIQAAKS